MLLPREFAKTERAAVGVCVTLLMAALQSVAANVPALRRRRDETLRALAQPAAPFNRSPHGAAAAGAQAAIDLFSPMIAVGGSIFGFTKVHRIQFFSEYLRQRRKTALPHLAPAVAMITVSSGSIRNPGVDRRLTLARPQAHASATRLGRTSPSLIGRPWANERGDRARSTLGSDRTTTP